MRSAPAICILLTLAGAAAAGELRAGAAIRKVTPSLDQPRYLAGFGEGRAATGVHDDLWTRCLALSSGAKPVVVCAVDTIGLFYDDVRKIRALVPEALLVVASTHVHEAPDTMGQWGPRMGVSGLDEAYNASIIEKTADAAREALQKLEPAQAFPASVTPRDVAAWYDDSRPPVVHDPEILSLTLRGRGSRTIATLVNWNNHPEALGSRNTLITSDWPHFMRAKLEAAGAGPVVFVNGAMGGMQSPLGAKIVDPATGAPAPANSFRFAEVVGEYAAGHVLASGKKAKRAKIDQVDYREAEIPIPVANQMFILASKSGMFKGRKAFTPDGMTVVPVGYLRLAAGAKPVVEVAMIPGEMYPENSLGGVVCDPNSEFPDAKPETPIKKMMTAPYRMLFGLANDEIGYILPKCQWDEKPPFTFGATKRWYGEVNSVGPEAAGRIAAAFEQLLRD
jgi:hypothetical protein